MPCYSGPSFDDADYSKIRDELDKTTRMLCEVCREVENNATIHTSPELDSWWSKHKLEDEKRRSSELKRAEEERKMEEASKNERRQQLKILMTEFKDEL